MPNFSSFGRLDQSGPWGWLKSTLHLIIGGNLYRIPTSPELRPLSPGHTLSYFVYRNFTRFKVTRDKDWSSVLKNENEPSDGASSCRYFIAFDECSAAVPVSAVSMKSLLFFGETRALKQRGSPLSWPKVVKKRGRSDRPTNRLTGRPIEKRPFNH